MFIGYARVSTAKAGCEKVFTDVASGARADREGLAEAMKFARKGDTLVVWKLDRLGRSIRHLIDTVSELESQGVGFRSVQEAIDTTTAGGQLVFHIFGALAQFERSLIKERTNAGLASARARGRLGGRPAALDETAARIAISLYESKQHTIAEICQRLNVSKPTLYRYLPRKVARS